MKNMIFFSCLLVCALSLPAFSQQSAAPPSTTTDPAVDDRIKALEERIIALEGQVRQLKSQPTAQAASAPAISGTAATTVNNPPLVQAQVAPETSAASASLPVYGGASAQAKALNPDISVIGDFIGAAGGNSIQPTPAFQMHESEVGLQAIIDPYARGDFFLSVKRA